MNIGIIGGGATGLLIGSYLAEKHTVTIYVRREEQKKALNNEGLILQDATDRKKIRALLSSNLQEADCFIVCVKQNAVSAIIRLLENTNENIPLIFLQNGMEHLDEVKTLTNPIMFGVMEHGALKHGDNLVEHTGKGSIKLAAYQGDENFLYQLSGELAQRDFPVDVKEDYLTLLQEKLIINAVINPLTALFQVPNGEVIHNPYLHKMARTLCEETCAVLNMDFSTQWAKVKKICESTAKNRSSMLEDILENRKTEIEAITGFILKKGKGVASPYSTFLFNSMKAIENEKGLTN